MTINTYDWADAPSTECAWDWKIFIENFMECYHHIGPHAKSLQKGSPAHMSWTDTSNHAYSYLHSAKTEEAIKERPWLDGAGNLLHIYPLTVMGLAKNGSSLHQISPLGPGRCRVQSISVANPDEMAEPDWPERLERRVNGNAINEEDKGVNKGVQLAVSARSAKAGRLSHLEQPLWEFYQYISAHLPVPEG